MTKPAAKIADLHSLLAPYVENRDVPGLAALVLRDGGEQVATLGVKTAGQPAPVARDTIFRVASMTKPITAVATLLLVEDGKLNLDEPVDRLLPELANRSVLKRVDAPLTDVEPAKRAITVRDLLTFQMGFGIVLAPPGTYPIQEAADELELNQGMPAPATPPAPDEWIRRFGKLPLMQQPGEQWQYNTGADVLGVLIARAAGKPFDSFLRERVCGPLGMVDTDFHVPAAKLARFTTSYVVDPETKQPKLYDAIDGQWSRPPAFPEGGGGLVSTVDDFARFSRFLLAGGLVDGKRVLSAASIRQMTSDQLTSAVKARGGLTPGCCDRHGWGFCTHVVTQRDELGFSAGSYGWNGGLGTSWYVDPTKQLAGVLLTNRSFESPDPPLLFKEFWRIVNA
jgi:CubicO group peptidase (beta-lactamase class C family)